MAEGPDPRVAAAFAAVDRRWFLPEEQRPYAAQDRPLAIGHGQTNSQPSTVAAMLTLLDVPPGARVLDVGSGSGWTTALLAVLVGRSGHVLGLERVPELAASGAANVAAWRAGFDGDAGDAGDARIELADPNALGRPVVGGWDRILVSAAADILPMALVAQLADDARMVIPVRHVMTLVARVEARTLVSEHGTYSFVPLIEG